MSAKHTPGPWIVRNSYNATVGTESQLTAVAYGDDPDCKPDERMRANARLIAAAPELLDALEELADLIDEIRSENYTPDSFTTQPARAAIAKATGGAA